MKTNGKFVLTMKGDILSPIIRSNNFDFITESNCYIDTLETISKNGDITKIPVFSMDYIPYNFYTSIQSVPLSVFVKACNSEKITVNN